MNPKSLVSLLFAATLVTANAGEELSVFLTDAGGTRRATVPSADTLPPSQNEALQVSGETTIMGEHAVSIDKNKTYRLSGWFSSVGQTPSNVYFGLRPVDRDGTPILPIHINAVEGTETELAEDCKVGDTEMKVRDASQWKAGIYYCVAFRVNPQGKYSDLPNRTLSPEGIADVSKDGNAWLVQLKAPMAAAYPKGTKVRQHLNTDTYIYCAAVRKIAPMGEFVQFEGTITGMAEGFSRDSFWPGTASVMPVVIANAEQGDDATLAVSNIELVEEK